MNETKNQPKIITCKNCGTKFSGNYCPECGQSKKEYDKPFRFLIIDFAGNLFAFDTRVWNTLKQIILRLGQLAKDFVEGRRARYMPPFRFYIFISFIFFLLLSLTSNESIRIETEKSVAVSDSLDIAGKEILKQNIDSAGTAGVINIVNRKIDLNDIRSHKEMYMSKFVGWMSSSLFFLMPVYGFFLWIFFRKRYKFYLGHLILAVNQHAVTFLVLILVIASELIFPTGQLRPVAKLLLIGVPVYYLVGARKMYGRGWFSTVWRMALIWLMYFLVTTACMLVVAFFAFSKV